MHVRVTSLCRQWCRSCLPSLSIASLLRASNSCAAMPTSEFVRRWRPDFTRSDDFASAFCWCLTLTYSVSNSDKISYLVHFIIATSSRPGASYGHPPITVLPLSVKELWKLVNSWWSYEVVNSWLDSTDQSGSPCILSYCVCMYMYCVKVAVLLGDSSNVLADNLIQLLNDDSTEVCCTLLLLIVVL